MHLSDNIYQEYPCLSSNPLKCDRPVQTIKEYQGAKFCIECAFPAILSQKAEIKGSRGIYQVENYLGARGWGRLYSGVRIKDKQPVVIKEYLLPSHCFNSNEVLELKETFKRIGGVNLADGKDQNFRIINTWEALADEKGERCYLITKDVEPKQTLREYLREKSAMTSTEVREVLNQALQTLEFLHTQKLCLPSQQIQQGLAHGNINLDSLLITETKNQNFYIFLCDLANWENLFIPPTIEQPALATFQQDLESLGKVAFYLLAGRDTNYTSGQFLSPREPQNWHTDDDNLKQYLFHLIGLEAPFDNAESARQALLKLPLKTYQHNENQQNFQEEKQQKRHRVFLIALIFLFLCLLGGGIWYWFYRKIDSPPQYVKWYNLKDKSFSDIELPPGNFNYTSESNSTWNVILSKENVEKGTVKEILTDPDPEAKAIFKYIPIKSEDITKISQPIENVKNNNIDFAVTTLGDKIQPSNLKKVKIAYDGLLVFVESRKNKSLSLHQKLKGEISLKHLRQIYIGDKTDWNQIDSKFPKEKIKPFIPEEPEAIYNFQKIVLQNNPQDIARFQQLVAQKIITKQNPEDTIREATKIRQTTKTGIIGFGTIGRIRKQCSNFYPLAIVNNNDKMIQPLYRSRTSGDRPIEPNDDLCRAELYFHVKTFKTYPLGYPLYITYPNDDTRWDPGKKFAKMLGKTRQGQCLLKEVDLVPLQQIPQNQGQC
ncbi:substrate-binding domain-containing protein [Calothrix rhizosoleniae]|uniref:substrate-binding domain-containing protein n=1 Tax=Calothrix rhizosoleniae TaxID=888997 RepID=UPI000B49E0E4|nr:substrate-binding domain-containing protein [Calothrix rhizosoleniae]